MMMVQQANEAGAISLPCDGAWTGVGRSKWVDLEVKPCMPCQAAN